MKKKIIVISCFFIIIIVLGCYMLPHISFHKKSSYTYTYDPEKAIAYSYEYIENRNPDFPAFEANCTNFIFQCLLAGGLEMDRMPLKQYLL